MAASEAQKKATKKYLETKDEIRIRMPIGKKEEIQIAAKKNGKSMNEYILEAIEREMYR